MSITLNAPMLDAQMSWPQLDEKELIRLAIDCNPHAYDEIMARNEPRLFAAIQSTVGCPHAAADIVQESFLKAFANLRSFRGDSGFYTWLYRIASNVRYRYVRKFPLRGGVAGTDFEPQVEPHSTDSSRPDSLMDRKERERAVHAALQRMNRSHRQVLVMHAFEGMDYRTISKRLNVAVGTVKSRLSRARASLRLELQHRLDEPVDE